jgi:exodeoxyribonuclease VII small subunit
MVEKDMEDLSFEEVLEKIEDVTTKLENGNLKLDESLDEFNKGVQLIKICNNKLENAKEKIKVFLLENEQETLWEDWKEKTNGSSNVSS